MLIQIHWWKLNMLLLSIKKSRHMKRSRQSSAFFPNFSNKLNMVKKNSQRWKINKTTIKSKINQSEMRISSTSTIVLWKNLKNCSPNGRARDKKKDLQCRWSIFSLVGCPMIYVWEVNTSWSRISKRSTRRARNNGERPSLTLKQTSSSKLWSRR